MVGTKTEAVEVGWSGGEQCNLNLCTADRARRRQDAMLAEWMPDMVPQERYMLCGMNESDRCVLCRGGTSLYECLHRQHSGIEGKPLGVGEIAAVDI